MKLIDEILTEWAYRVHDGMPNPKNAQHIHELRESMEELNLPNNVIYQVIQNLITEQDKKLSRQGILDVLKTHKELEQQEIKLLWRKLKDLVFKRVIKPMIDEMSNMQQKIDDPNSIENLITPAGHTTSKLATAVSAQVKASIAINFQQIFALDLSFSKVAKKMDTGNKIAYSMVANAIPPVAAE